MTTIQYAPKTLTLPHHVTSQPTQARQVGYLYEKGRAIGLKLDFGDGGKKGYQMVYSLTYAEIEKLRADTIAIEVTP